MVLAGSELGKEDVAVDASVVARGLGIEPATVEAAMREGTITSTCEAGVGEDARCFRLTFFHGNRRLRLLLDDQGKVTRSSTVDFGDRPLPSSLRRPGG